VTSWGLKIHQLNGTQCLKFIEKSMTNAQNRQSVSVSRYANALFQLAKEAKVIDTVSNDLTSLEVTINSDVEILKFIQNPSIKKSLKVQFFNTVSQKLELSKLTENFIGLIIKKNRVHYILEMIRAFNDLLSELKGIKSANITSAYKLSDEEVSKIKMKLKDKFNSDFNINLLKDSSLIGGLKIQVGSQMIDSSIKNQLNLLKAKMKEVA
jgi:F-type H+-transporting ATPase subunit delta|tara:strand:- start:2369 stop:2998 length:630 start_codon:yes stop_codon:yes gene_type:complete